jgi:hypothetical protein
VLSYPFVAGGAAGGQVNAVFVASNAPSRITAVIGALNGPP